ncbi:hypothetical protein AMTRI_Chr07g78690 [Amborella trichopoda]
MSWTCRVEQFFQFHQILKEEHVALASFHLEGDAQLWYQLFKQEGGEMTWQTFCDRLHARYGPTQFQDFFGEFAKLQQIGTVRDYQTQFERLLTKMGYLPPSSRGSCFISGLRNNIKVDMLARHPTTLSAAIKLAHLYEAHNFLQRRVVPTSDANKSITTSKEATNSGPTLPVRRMTLDEV